MTTALLIIDTQRALFEDESASLYNQLEVLETIKKLIFKARSKNIPILYVQHTEKSGAFQRHKESWMIHSDISPLPGDKLIEKTSWDAFYQTTLDQTLKSLAIKKLVVLGMQTEYCLDTSLRCGYSKGYHFDVIEDGHTTFDGLIEAEKIIKHHNFIWHNRFARVIHSDFFTFD